MEFRQVLAWLRSKGELVEVDQDSFISDLKRYDGQRCVLERGEGEVRRVGNAIISREELIELLNLRSVMDLHHKVTWAIRNPSPLHEAAQSTSEEVSENGVSFLNVPDFQGKRYVTAGVFIASDGKRLNSSFHRMLYLGNDKFAVRVVPRHLYRMLEEARQRREKLDVAVVIGGPLEFLIASSSSPPFGVFELEVANSLSGGSIAYKRSPEHGIPYPADSEILLEGYIDPEELAPEGPFFDVLRTFDTVRAQPVFTVEKAYHRKEALFHVIWPGGVEHQMLMGLPKEAKIREAVENVVPEVNDVYLTPGGGTWVHAAISISKQRDGDPKNVIMAAFGAHPSLKHVIVVDEDVDVRDPASLEWALATRFRADRGLVVIPSASGSTLDPSAGADGETAKVGVDATAPIRERDRFKRADVS
ncbi:MAG: UbiD family decarboxylase [Thermoprotei archaeon]